MRLLTRDEIRAFYDGFGARQDTQGWYEDVPLGVLKDEMRFGDAASIVELGCGTGRLAHEIVTERAPADVRYLGIDLSTVMVSLAANRLRGCPSAHAVVGDITRPLPLGDGCADRVFAAYVLDILSPEDIGAVFGEAARILRPGGLFGAVSLTRGPTAVSRLASAAWTLVHRVKPAAVGGCRPLELLGTLPDAFRLTHACKKVAGGIPSEVVVAERRG